MDPVKQSLVDQLRGLEQGKQTRKPKKGAKNPRAMTHAELLMERMKEGAEQDVLGPLEHGAFAREWTQENPVVAVPSLLASIPGYTLAKLLGLQNGRSSASIDEMAEGYRGMWEGLTGK